MSSRILILDYGAQYTQLIARRVREARVYSEIHPPTRSLDWIREWNPTGIILSGGPNSVYADDAPTADRALLDIAPVLGILVMTSSLAFARRSKDTRRLTLTGAATLNGAQVPAGEYNVSWVSHSPEATVTFQTGHDVVATAEGKWVDRHTPYQQNAVVVETNPDGSRSIVEIRFAGMSEALVFGGSSPSAAAVPPEPEALAAGMPAGSR